MTNSFNHYNDHNSNIRQVTDLDGNTHVLYIDDSEPIVELIRGWAGDDIAIIVHDMINKPISHDTKVHNLKKKLSIANKTNSYQKKRIKFLEDILTRKGITFK